MNNHWLIEGSFDPAAILAHSYDFPLVVLSYFIAVLAAYSSQTFSGRIKATLERDAQLAWLAFGSFSMGSGIWAMHFLGMLAFSVPVALSYDLVTTGLSVVPAIFASMVTIQIIGYREISVRRIVIGGVMLGGGIGAMHYLGMAAVQTEAVMMYDPARFILSIVVAILLSVLALSVSYVIKPFNLTETTYKIAGALIMGMSVTLMHYTAMSATYFVGTGAEIVPGTSSETHIIAYTLGGVIFVVLIATLNAANLDRRLGASQQALASSELRLQCILDNMPDAIIMIDSEGVVKTVNPAVETIFGYKPDECLGQDMTMFMTKADTAAHGTFIDACILTTDKTGVTNEGCEREGLRKDGTLFPMSLGISEVEIHGERAFVCIARNITERKTAEWALATHGEQLEESLDERTRDLRCAVAALQQEVVERRKAENEAHYANRAKSEFLANMSHELRTPLNAILGFSEIIERRLFGDSAIDRYAEYATDIRESGDHLLNIINDILDLAKIEAGEMEIDESVIDMAQLLESCERLTSERAQSAELKLTCQADPGPVRIYADGRKMKQVLINLLANSIKFTPPGGKITVRAHLGDDDSFMLDVEDTGIGIAEADIEKVQAPFGQVEGALTRDTAGTGLGLPLVKSLVELHGGKIEITSTLGVGTKVSVVLPASRIEKTADRDEAARVG